PSENPIPEALTKLVKSLAPYGFTKAEKLQIVNLAPQEQIELYAVSVSCSCSIKV
ncbi:hypothetical protein C8F01DRAFT_979301, partial [Mycena amicta]